MNKFISRLMLASATVALATAMPVAANAALTLGGGPCPGSSGCPVDGTPWTVSSGTYELITSNVFSPSSLTVDGAANPGVIIDPGATLNDDAIIGDANSGMFTNNGTHNVSGNLILGNQSTGIGTYTITGDSAVTSVAFADPAASGQPNGALIVGNGGTGTFNQGTDASTDPNNQVNVAGDLALGHSPNSQGTYNLNSGALTVGGQLSVGGQSTNANVFNQYSGSVTLTGSSSTNSLYASVPPGSGAFDGKLAIGGGIDNTGGNAGGNGTYNLFGGSVDTTFNGIEIGASGTGTMNQSGGTVNSTFLTMGFGGTGTYNLSGDSSSTVTSFAETVGYAGTGTFNQSGGVQTIGLNSDGSLQTPGATALEIGLQCCGNSPGAGTYNMTGGVLNTGNMTVGDGEQGSFIQSPPAAIDPTVNVTGNLVVGGAAGGNGSYTITGDQSTLNVLFAPGGNGTGNTNGGSNTANANGALIVGEFGTGAFVQGNGVDAPTVTVAGDLSVGHQGLAGNPDSVADSSGSYTINSGSLTVGGSIGVGAASTGTTGPGNIFTQNGGTVTVTGSAFGNGDYVGVGTSDHIGELFIGGAAGPDNDGGTGTYNMNGGVLNVGLIEDGHAGLGVMNQTGGTVNASLWLGNAGGSSGTYNLSGGTLNAGDEQIGLGGGGSSVFTQTAGTNNTDSLELGTEYGTTGTYNISGDPASVQLNVTNGITVGSIGQGVFNQSGGTVTAASLTMGTTGTIPNGSGIYNLSGNGQLSVSGDETIGQFGYGEFNQGNNSNNAVGGSLYLASLDNINPNGGFHPREGVYTITGGTLSTTNTFVGELGLGIFNQSGGTHTISNQLVIGDQAIPLDTTACGGACTAGGPSQGTYNMSAGSLTADSVVVGNFGLGAFNILGNSNVTTANDVTIAQNSGSAGSSMAIGNGLDSPTVQIGGFLTVGSADVGSLTLNSGSLSVGQITFVGGGASGVGTMTQNGGSFETTFLDIGNFAPNGGSYTMAGGTLTVDANLVLGSVFSPGSSGTFTQTGGAVGAGGVFINNTSTYGISAGSLTTAGTIFVGHNSGTDAQFNQSGGTVTAGQVIVGNQLGIGGTYNLTGGTLNDDAIVGEAGTGMFNNAGSTHNVTGNLILGDQATGNGTYNLTAGGVTTVTPTGSSDGFTFVGLGGTGTFLNDGSTHTTKVLVLGLDGGSNGTYTLQNGGSVNVGTVANTGFLDVGEHGTGTYNQTGGTTTVIGSLDVGRCGSAAGCLGVSDTDTGAGNSTVNLSGGSLSVSEFAVVGDSGTGTFNQSGGSTVTTGGELAIGRSGGTGTYNLGGTASLTVGSNATGGSIVLGNAGSSGTFNLSGSGSVTVTAGTDAQTGTIFDGTAGTGMFTQSGTSTVLATNVSVGNNTGGIGTYTLSGGTLTLLNELFVGGGGQGTFTQSGASSIVTTAFLSVGNNVGGVGNYNLSAGSLTAFGDAFLGGDNLAQGTITQTGGTAALEGNVNVGFAAGATGIYTLGGSGAATIGGNLDIGVAANATGTVNFNTAGGDAATLAFTTPGSTLTVGDAGSGIFNQGGGDLNLAAEGVTLDIGAQKGSSGHYNLSGGSLEDGLIVGDAGTGVVNNSGGSHSVSGDLVLGSQATGNGTYNLSGTGALAVSGNVIVGAAGLGDYDQTGGTASVTGNVTVNNSGTPNGSSLTVSSGSLSATTITNNDLLNITGGTVTAAVTNNQQFNMEGGTVAGPVTNNGTMDTSSGGTATVTGALNNTSTGTTNITGNSTLAVGGSVMNAGTVTVGSGSELNASGTTYTQSGGTTTVDGQIAATVAAATGGTFTGTGTIDGNLSNTGGTVKPGDGAPGTLAVTGTYHQEIAAIFEAGIAGTNSDQVSKLNVTGGASLSGTLDVDLLNGFQVASGDVFNIMNFASSIGDFTNFELNGSACTSGGADIYNCSALGDGLFFQEEFVNGDTGLDLVIGQTVVGTPVPEPWTIELFGAGLAGLAAMRRRRKAKKS
jgi:fibronectin-binding autotransporter adhesin